MNTPGQPPRMSRPGSRQRPRQTRRDPDEAVLELVQAHAREPDVESVEGEFQGDWNVLAMFIHVAPGMTDAEVLKLQRDLHGRLQQHFHAHALPFTWSVGIWRGGKPLGIVGSNQCPDAFCDACQSRYHWAFAECPRCAR